MMKMEENLENLRVYLAEQDVSEDVSRVHLPTIDYEIKSRSAPGLAFQIPVRHPHRFKKTLAVLDLSRPLYERLKGSKGYHHISITALVRNPDGSTSDMISVLRGPCHAAPDADKLIVDVETFLCVLDGKPVLVADRAMSERDETINIGDCP